MITGFLLNVFYGVLQFFVNRLPISSIPQDGLDAIVTVWSYVNAMSFLFPVGTLLTVLGLAMTFHGVIMLWRFSALVANYLRGR